MTFASYRNLGALIAASIFASGAAFGQADTWPERQVRIVMPFPAGGASDVMTRLLAERLQAKLGQPFVVENRTGAGGNIGMEAGVKAAPDGYTITSATIGTLAINQHLFASLPYDPEKGFVYATTFWMNCNMVMVSPQHNPNRTLQDFISWSKTQPKGITYGSSGVGTTPHLAGELFRLRTGTNATHVPARGAPQTIPMCSRATSPSPLTTLRAIPRTSPVARYAHWQPPARNAGRPFPMYPPWRRPAWRTSSSPPGALWYCQLEHLLQSSSGCRVR